MSAYCLIIWCVRRAYRKAVVTADINEKLKEICADRSLRYEIEFLEIEIDNDHIHFLVQSLPTYSPTKIVRTIKSITAKEIFRQMPEVKKTVTGRRVLVRRLFPSHRSACTRLKK